MLQPLSLKEFQDLISQGHTVIDARQPTVFAEGFIPQSVSVPFGETFINTLSEVTEDEQQLVIVADEADIAGLSNIIRTSVITNVDGYLTGGFETWRHADNQIDLLITIDADEFAIDYQFDEFYLVDVRDKETFDQEHVEDAENIVLSDLEQIIVELPTEDMYYVYGDTVAAGITAASIFKRNGFHRLRAIAVDLEALKTAGIAFFTARKKTKPPFPASEN